MNNISSLAGAALALLLSAGMSHAQTLSCAEVQGETEVSPYEGEEVTVSGKVTVFYGDMWYLQDGFGAWNGLYCVGPDVVIDANPPWWNAPRQPEVGDVLELTGTVVEQDGNTQLVDITDFVFVDFWNATAAGTAVTVDGLADESLEGTRVRLDPVTVETAPDMNGMWTVSDATGTATVLGVDTDDPSGNEDVDGPTPGDVYRVYGALRQIGEEYVIDLGDIDTLSLVVDVPDLAPVEWSIAPNPAQDFTRISGLQGVFQWVLTDALGRPQKAGKTEGECVLTLDGISSGRYTLHVSGAFGKARRTLIVQ
jgi:hypothetical protein